MNPTPLTAIPGQHPPLPSLNSYFENLCFQMLTFIFKVQSLDLYSNVYLFWSYASHHNLSNNISKLCYFMKSSTPLLPLTIICVTASFSESDQFSNLNVVGQDSLLFWVVKNWTLMVQFFPGECSTLPSYHMWLTEMLTSGAVVFFPQEITMNNNKACYD